MTENNSFRRSNPVKISYGVDYSHLVVGVNEKPKSLGVILCFTVKWIYENCFYVGHCLRRFIQTQYYFMRVFHRSSTSPSVQQRSTIKSLSAFCGKRWIVLLRFCCQSRNHRISIVDYCWLNGEEFTVCLRWHWVGQDHEETMANRLLARIWWDSSN